MMTFLLGENQDGIDFKVFTVQADNPPKNFAAGWSKKYPVVMVNSGTNKTGQDLSGAMYDTFEELEQFFESINRECPELKNKNAPNLSAMKVVADLYKVSLKFFRLVLFLSCVVSVLCCFHLVLFPSCVVSVLCFASELFFSLLNYHLLTKGE